MTMRSEDTTDVKTETNNVFLKPCPFCGGEKILFDKCTSRVMCMNCFARNPMISKFFKYTDDESEAALMAWNTRDGELWQNTQKKN